MAVGTSWAFGPFAAVVTFGGFSNASVADLAGGGYAVTLEGSAASTLVLFFNADNQTTGSAIINGATNAQLVQRNGAVHVVYRKDGATFEQALSTIGSIITAETPVQAADSTPTSTTKCEVTTFNQSVTLDGGGQDSNVGFVFDAGGGVMQSVVISSSTTDHDTFAKAVCLEDGGFAILWSRRTGPGPFDNDAWYAVYNQDGSVRHAPARVDITDVMSPEIIADSDGGFTIRVLEPIAGFGTTTLDSVSFDAAGNELGTTPVVIPGAVVGQSASRVDPGTPGAGVTVVASDMAAVTYANDTGGAALDVQLDLVDIVTGQSLMGGPLTIAAGIATGADTDVAAIDRDGVALVYETDDGVVIGTADLVATTVGDVQANTIAGGDQTDVVSAQGGNDSVAGGEGNDRIRLGAGNDTGDGGAGNDTLDYSGANGVIIDLDLTAAQDTGLNGIDTIVNFENVIGSNGNDQIRGDENVNVLVGGKGNDLLRGLAANDRLEGGAGNDELFGGVNDDLLFGGLGDDNIDGNLHGVLGDTASYADVREAVTIDLRIVTSQDTGGGGFDRLFDIEHLVGTKRGDTLIGSNVRNDLFGGDGGDTLNGGVGTDNLFGEAGNDILIGGESNDPNNDVLRGGLGRDTLNGGAGGDRFVYGSVAECGLGANADRIMDFISPGGDKIDLSAVFAGTLAFIGAAAFGGVAGQVRLETLAAYQRVQIDIDGNGVSDGDLRIMNSGATDASSFLL